MEEMLLGEWVKRAREAGLRKDFAAYLQNLEQGSHEYHYPTWRRRVVMGIKQLDPFEPFGICREHPFRI